MIAYETVSLIVKTACLVVGIGTESPIGASCCITFVVEVVVPNIWTTVNVCEALRTSIMRSADLEVRGRQDFAMSYRCKTLWV